jgi:hypothetical protein
MLIRQYAHSGQSQDLFIGIEHEPANWGKTTVQEKLSGSKK